MRFILQSAKLHRARGVSAGPGISDLRNVWRMSEAGSQGNQLRGFSEDLLFKNLPQVLTIAAVPHLICKGRQLCPRDIAKTKGDFFRTSNFQTLPLFNCLDE